ncbi:unnamed protein product [Moneuplotes crassus]|uniref:Uncharacterized protein n=1 Tax=Euplotes crassus TaxID=5936 RepID=A0AAD2D787_EUPCR|nr:unnamed protein product [Moneuplotes crassus]
MIKKENDFARKRQIHTANSTSSTREVDLTIIWGNKNKNVRLSAERPLFDLFTQFNPKEEMYTKYNSVRFLHKGEIYRNIDQKLNELKDLKSRDHIVMITHEKTQVDIQVEQEREEIERAAEFDPTRYTSNNFAFIGAGIVIVVILYYWVKLNFID